MLSLKLTCIFMMTIFTTGYAAPGLFPLSSARVPPSVQSASRAVFRIVKFSKEPWFISSSDYDSAAIKWKGKGFVGKLIAEDIQRCSAKKLPRCPIVYSSTGTGFLALEQNLLFSVRHGFKQQLEEFEKCDSGSSDPVAKHEALLKHPLQFALFDREGKLIFDTRNPADSAHFEVLGAPELMEIQSDALDFAVIQLSRPLSYPLIQWIPPRQFLKPGEPVFVPGYPLASEGRTKQHSVPDSDGKGFLVSLGKTLDYTDSYLAKR